MGLYYIAIKDRIRGVEVKDILARAKMNNYSPNTSPYIAFTTKQLGKKYLESRRMSKHFTLLTLPEVKNRCSGLDTNNGTVVFQNEKQIADSFLDVSGESIEWLIQ